MGDHTLTVLLVEDNELLQEAIEAMLEQMGFGVLTADNARQALACEGGFDLLMTDVRMPEISGLELADRARVKWPGVPIVFISAGRGEELGEWLHDERCRFIGKPFSYDELAEAVNSIAPVRG